jgi:uncharacterized membrane protein YeaQ/YmgE (transglycosylase-associated protein family)
MGFVILVLIGFLVGVVAKLINPGKDDHGFLITALIGVAGAFIGTYIGQGLGIYNAGESAGFIGAVLGAVLILMLSRMIKTRGKTLP